MERQTRIARLIQRRKPLAAAAVAATQVLSDLRTKLSELDSLRLEIAEQLPVSPIRAALESFSFAQQSKDGEGLLLALERVAKRFSRERLQIGVLGLARMGKSTLLQRLTGLGPDLIPSGNLDHCTGTRSVIVNDSTIEQPWARIHFHDERSFLQEVVRPYYQHFATILPRSPNSLDAFLATDLQRPEFERIKSSGGESTAKLNNMRRLHDELPQFRRLLRGGTQDVKKIEEIARYVAQRDSQQQRIPLYQAVEHAEIFCRFPRGDVTDIAFVDMPGLGDTGIGPEQQLVRIMAEDTDIVLMIKLPPDVGANWSPADHILYRVADQAVGDLLPLKRWMLLVLNRRTDVDNSHNCAALERQREKDGIIVARALTARCDDREDVFTNVMDPSLSFLESELEELDRLYVRNLQAQLAAYAKEVAARCEVARRLVPRLRSGDSTQVDLWLKLHKQFYKRLREEIGKLVRQLRRDRAETDQRLRLAVDAILQPIASGRDTTLLPAPEEVEKLADHEGGWPGAIQESMNRIRSELTHRLLRLDDSLQETFAEAKTLLVQAIENTSIHLDRARLGDDTLGGLAKWANETGCLELENGFRFASEFRLTYFGFIHHRIRKQLDSLVPDDQTIPLVSGGRNPGQKAVEHLKHAVHEAVYLIQESLEKLVAEPAMARFAMVEEFKDQVLRREQIEDEWERLTFEYKTSLWPDQFDKAKGEAGLHQKWIAAVDNVDGLAASPGLTLAPRPM
jgi:hypothetical protein